MSDRKDHPKVSVEMPLSVAYNIYVLTEACSLPADVDLRGKMKLLQELFLIQKLFDPHAKAWQKYKEDEQKAEDAKPVDVPFEKIEPKKEE